jgi:PAP2 superfamily
MKSMVQVAAIDSLPAAIARRRVVVAALALTLFAIAAPARASDAVMEWNDIARTLTVVPALAPVQQTRVMAIVQVAVHDAVNAITGEYETYQSIGGAPAGASPDAAAIAAAHHALKALFGTGNLDEQYVASLAAHSISELDPGIEFGRSVAAGILTLRAQDGSAQAAFPYLPPGAGLPGVWVPLGSQQALLPGWGNVSPWVLRSGSQFRPEAPPALDSDRYARDYNEVLEIGEHASSVRTDEQTQLALFWRASPTAIWNNVLRQVLADRELDLSATARAFALFYLAAADASVACWEAKYTYNFWRPLPAIVNGGLDGNDATSADSNWAPLLATPAHPDYPSAHTTNSSAMATVLQLVFGGDVPGILIEATSAQNPGFIRYWQAFSEGVQEVIDARVYSGFHFRTADEVGARLGRHVAHFVVTHSLRPMKGSWKD